MQFIDLKKQYSILKVGIDSAIQNVLDHGSYIMGPEVFELEKQLAEFASVKHCISCSSGTDSLLMGLMAADVGPGDGVFTSPFTFIATAEVIRLVGATPVFVEIQADTFNIDPEQLEAAILECRDKNELTAKAVIPVDIFGLPADFKKIDQICKQYDLLNIEDAAQSFGGSINGRKTGSFGDMAATSFFPAKPLGCYGDGGAVFTNDDEFAEKLKSIRVHGKGNNKYDNVRIGINGRLDTLQAAILLEKLKIFPEEIRQRNKVAKSYWKSLKDQFVLQEIPSGSTSAWAQFSLLAESTEQRELICSELKETGIPTAVYYPKPLHLQDAFKKMGYNSGDFPVTEAICSRIFSLPMHPYLEVSEVQEITNILINSMAQV